jgi:phage gpG-like protein
MTPAQMKARAAELAVQYNIGRLLNEQRRETVRYQFKHEARPGWRYIR